MSFDINDAQGGFETKGFVDTHIHGAFGADTSDGDVEGIITMAKRLPEFGVRAFCPTTMTISPDDVKRSFEAVSRARDILDQSSDIHAGILGIHLEGPFLSTSKAAVQDSSFCMVPEKGFDLIESLEKDYPGLLKIIDIAPELDGSTEFIREFGSRYVISLAHTEADYDTACAAFEAGAVSVTHMLNAMEPASKRSPGVLGAAFDNNAWCELICDGIHISPPVLRMLFAMYDEDKLIVVSDSMRAAGMPDGTYRLGTADVEVKDGRTYYGEGRNLAGSVTNLSEEFMRLHAFGIGLDKALKALTSNPLKRLGLDPDRTDTGKNIFASDLRLFRSL